MKVLYVNILDLEFEIMIESSIMYLAIGNGKNAEEFNEINVEFSAQGIVSLLGK